MRLLVLTAFMLYTLIIVSRSSTNDLSKLLECSVDQTQLENIIHDIESKGYSVKKQRPGMLSSGGNFSNLAPNTGGAYASILRNNASYHIEETFVGLPFTYKMGAKSAILFHGCTAPKTLYFGYKTYIWKNDKNMWLWGALGDVINHRTINTYNKFTQIASPPFDDLTTIISTADTDTYDDILNVYKQYGITEDMINLDHIPSDIIKMGTNYNTSLHTLYRVNIPISMDQFAAYFANINNEELINVYFITKGDEATQTLPENAIPTPPRKERDCTNSSYINNGDEYYLEPKYEELRDKLINTMRNQFEYKTQKMRKIIGSEYHGFDCIEDNSLCAGNSPDCLYYEDYNNQSFLIKAPNGQNILNRNIEGYKLKEGNLYIILGVNHYNLGLAAFNQETIYDEKYAAIDVEGTTMDNFEYNNSANYFGDYDEFYMIMYVRPNNCIQEMVNNGVKCVEIGYDKLDKNIGFIVFSRAYLNPCTNTGPSKDQFLYEYILEFKAKGGKKGGGKIMEEYTIETEDKKGWEFLSTAIQIMIILTCLLNGVIWGYQLCHNSIKVGC